MEVVSRAANISGGGSVFGSGLSRQKGGNSGGKNSQNAKKLGLTSGNAGKNNLASRLDARKHEKAPPSTVDAVTTPPPTTNTLEAGHTPAEGLGSNHPQLDGIEADPLSRLPQSPSNPNLSNHATVVDLFSKSAHLSNPSLPFAAPDDAVGSPPSVSINTVTVLRVSDNTEGDDITLHCSSPRCLTLSPRQADRQTSKFQICYVIQARELPLHMPAFPVSHPHPFCIPAFSEHAESSEFPAD
jgi:hypothetical protein